MLSSSVPTIIATVGGDENIVLKMSLNCNNYKKRKEKKKSDKHVIELMYWLARICIFLDGVNYTKKTLLSTGISLAYMTFPFFFFFFWNYVRNITFGTILYHNSPHSEL